MSMDLGDEHPGLALSGEISEVVEKLRLYLSNNSNSFKGTLKKLDVLEDKLRSLRLDNLLQVKPHKEEAASACLRLLKKVTQDAKELLDDMESEVNECNSSISDVIMTWLASDHRNQIRMAYIIGKLASVCADAQSLHDAIGGETKYLLDDDFLIGRDEEIAMIRDMVLDNAQYVAVAASLEGRAEADKLHTSQKKWIIETLQNIDQSKKTQEAAEDKEMGYKNPTVIPIVGISGVGKSALARFIFKHESVREHFGDQSAWVYMTDRISQEEMIKQIVFSFSPEHVVPNLTIDLKDVHTVLQSIIEGKRFFLVLDDVWDEIRAIWSGLRSVLSKGAPGSVVLVTTQLYGVASSIGTTGPIVLDPLQYDDSWALLKQYYFADPCGSQSMQAFEPIGRKVTDRLYGLPLAIKVIGASLRNNFEESHWEKLLKGWWWNYSDDSLYINIISSLGSCYSVLPGYLRQCFVYFSIFPRNYVFEKNKLVLMWIANGFIHLNSSTSASRLEDIAGKWFDELVSRAFLQPSVWKAGYVMHNLVRDFACALSSNEYHGVDSKLRDVSQICHLSIEMNDMNVQPADFNKKLRTLLLFGDFHQFSSGKAYYHLDGILKSSTSLRVLDFVSTRWSAATTSLLGYQAQDSCEQYSQRWQWTSFQKSLSDAIGGLRHLRHLDLSFTGINELPDSICTLHHIQVLGLRGCKFKMLPVNMNTMTSLRHLHADVVTTALIYGIGKLTELQELEEFCVEADDGHRITELRDLSNIRGSLCISNLNMVADREEALKANLFTKHYLTSLCLKWEHSMAKFYSSKRAADIQAEETCSGLSFPKHMQELKVSHYPGCAFPDWAEQLKHIQFVEITSCEKLEVLPPLGQLEHLHKLKLHKLPSIEDINSEAYGMSNVVFKSLVELSFEDMQYWENWADAGGREFIPNLQKLRIIRCNQLKKVPFESLGSATKEMVLDGYNGNVHMISRYLTRLTGLTRLEILNSWGGLEGKLILPCEELRSLEYLHIKCFDRVCIKGGLWYIRNLKDLRLADVHTVTTELDEESPHEEKHDPTQSDRSMHSLSHLHLDSKSLPTDLNTILSKTPSLRTLCLDNIGQLTSISEQWFQQRTSLRELELSSSRTLPSSLASLSSLKKLSLKNCQIYSIPPNSLPGNLKEMQIEGPCSIEFEARFQNTNGEVWLKGEKMDRWRRSKMEEWRESKMEEWRESKNKLIEAVRKKRELLESQRKKGEEFFSNIKEPLKSAKEESLLGEEDEWLQHSEWRKLEKAEDEWLRRKLEEALRSNEEGPSNLKKEMEEWLKEEEQKLLEPSNWPNIAHVPYIRVNGEIVQNLYT